MAKKNVPPLLIALIIVGVLACSAFIYFQIVRAMAPADATATVTAGLIDTPPPTPPPEPPPPELPSLEASDETVRALAETLSAHPQLATWLAPDRLVRRLVASVVDVANDESPRPHIGFLEPPGEFRVGEDHGHLVVDSRSYVRYDRLVEVFTSLDAAASLRLYHQLKPLFDEAYQSLGYPDGDFNDALIRALDNVLETPIPAGKIEVKRRVTNYRFADRRLEALSPVQKHLIRMGPTNARAIKQRLQVIRSALSGE